MLGLLLGLVTVSLIFISNGCCAMVTGKHCVLLYLVVIYACAEYHTHRCLIVSSRIRDTATVTLSTLHLEGTPVRCLDAVLLLFNCPYLRVRQVIGCVVDRKYRDSQKVNSWSSLKNGRRQTSQVFSLDVHTHPDRDRLTKLSVDVAR